MQYKVMNFVEHKQLFWDGKTVTGGHFDTAALNISVVMVWITVFKNRRSQVFSPFLLHEFHMTIWLNFNQRGSPNRIVMPQLLLQFFSLQH